MTHYEVVVGNVGIVHTCSMPIEACRIYGAYKDASLSGYGRAGGEPVTLLADGEVKYEYEGDGRE
jgi:hypothetical protein